jgi:hypothetical protein
MTAVYESFVEQVGRFQKHQTPNGLTAFYGDAAHDYYADAQEKAGKWVGKGRLGSPSTIAKYADANPDHLISWGAKIERTNVASCVHDAVLSTPLAQLPDALAWCSSADEVGVMLRDLKMTWRDSRGASGDVGSITHYALEAGLRGQRQSVDGVPLAAQPYVAAVNAFLDERTPVAEQIESVIVSTEHGFAGRFDARVKVDGSDDVWLIDCKTSKSVDRRTYHVQMAGYEIGCRESGYGASDQQAFLHVRDDGSYELVPALATPQHFLDALSLYQQGKTLDKALRAQARERKATNE